jgi:hypothetical protein
MKALAWSIALISFAFVANVSAADKPTPAKPADEGEGVIVPLMVGADHDHYWIGLDADSLPAEQRKELHVDDDQGLLINAVTPDSPAAKAGFEVHDILLKADKKPLKQIADLSGAIQESKDQPLLLEVNRGGKLQTIAVTPAKRPSGGLTFQIINPEIHLGGSGAASAEKLKAEGATRQALNWLTGHAGEPEPSGSEDAKVRDRIMELLAHRDELKQRVKATERAIEAICEQDVTNQLGRAERETLIRQLKTLRQCAADLAEVGRTEEASHLGSAAHELEQQLKAIGRPEPEQMRLSQIRTAIQLLGQNGMPEDAERVRQKVDAIAREQQQRRETLDGRVGPRSPDSAIIGLRDQIEQMHREMAELKEAVARMSQRKD